MKFHIIYVKFLHQISADKKLSLSSNTIDTNVLRNTVNTVHLNEEKVVIVPGDDPSTQRKRSSLPMIDDLLEASKKNLHSSDTLPPLCQIQYCQPNTSIEELSGNKYFFTQIIGQKSVVYIIFW